MKRKTKQKVSDLLNDIYLKSKANLTFNTSEIRRLYKVGSSLLDVLRNKGLINRVGTGKYIYLGTEPNSQIINDICRQYAQINREKNQKSRKDKVNKNTNQLKLTNDQNEIKELKDRINKIEYIMKEMDILLKQISCTFITTTFNPKPKKSFFAKLFF